MQIGLTALQVDKIVGKAAPGDFIEKLEELANAHHDDLELDVIRAYFFGARFIVEVLSCPCLGLASDNCIRHSVWSNPFLFLR